VTGKVDREARALVDLSIRPRLGAAAHTITAWIDTAFTGELVIPRDTIDKLQLHQSSAITAGLADGSQAVLETFSCFVEWLDEERQIEAIESDGLLPLLGVGLLSNCRLEIDYRLTTVAID
jgi:clan AA aspartic protease